MDEKTRQAKAKKCADLLHAVQTGIAMGIECGSFRGAEPKHMRVGLDNVLIGESVLMDVLVEKGIVEAEELLDRRIAYLKKEVANHERELSRVKGIKIKLG